MILESRLFLKNKNVPITGVNKIRAVLAEKIYGDKQNSKELDNFEEVVS